MEGFSFSNSQCTILHLFMATRQIFSIAWQRCNFSRKSFPPLPYADPPNFFCCLPGKLRRMIIPSGLVGHLVLYPVRSIPQGDTGQRFVCFADVPPPWGWLPVSIAFPRTEGRQPCQRRTPAFPNKRWLCSGLDNWPMDAQHSTGNFRISVLMSFMVTCVSSFCKIVAKVPAERINCLKYVLNRTEK